MLYIYVKGLQNKICQKYKNYVPYVLDEAKTSFTPSITRESSNAAPASREHEKSVYTVHIH